MRIWSYSPEAEIKYRRGLLSSVLLAIIIPLGGFFLCKWGIETGKIPMEAIFFIGIVFAISPFQIIGAKTREMAKEKLKFLYVFVEDNQGDLYYIYLSADSFLDITRLRKNQIDNLRYHNFIIKAIQKRANEKNRKILITTVRDNDIINRLISEGTFNKVAVPIHNVEEIKKYGNHIVITCTVGNLDNPRKKLIAIYKVIDGFEQLYDKITTKASCLNV